MSVYKLTSSACTARFMSLESSGLHDGAVVVYACLSAHICGGVLNFLNRCDAARCSCLRAKNRRRACAVLGVGLLLVWLQGCIDVADLQVSNAEIGQGREARGG